MSGDSSRRYPPELRERAVRMVAEIRDQHETRSGRRCARWRGCSGSDAETVRKWVRQAEIDAGARPGVSTEESAELKRLKRENAELEARQRYLGLGSTVWWRELGVCVVDGVRDVGAGDAVGAELSVQECDLVPQLTVFVVEFADAFVCESEALPQRGVGAALGSGGCRLGLSRDMAVSRRSWSRSSGWAYSHERETPAWAAIWVTVRRWPVSLSSCRAWRARSRVSARRRWAAARRWWLLSWRIG